MSTANKREPRLRKGPLLLTTLLLLLTAVVVGCIEKTYNLHLVRAKLGRFNALLNEAKYAQLSYGKNLELRAEYEKYEHLFTDQELLDYVDDIKERDPLERARLRYLHRELVERFLGYRTSLLSERIERLRRANAIVNGDEQLNLSQIVARLGWEPNDIQRERLSRARAEYIVNILNPLLQERLRLEQESCQELGYVNLLDMHEHIRGQDFIPLTEKAEECLKRTKELYHELLENRAQRILGMPAKEISASDRFRLLCGEDFDGLFPEANLLPFLRETIEGLGLRHDHITIDAQFRSQKIKEAACLAIEIPADVRLLVQPARGLKIYQQLFQEMGRALYFANVKRSEYEFRQLGHETAAGAYGAIFKDLLTDANFLVNRLPLDDDQRADLMIFSLFQKLTQLRLCCARFLHQYQLYAGDSDAQRHYVHIMERAFQIPQEQEEYGAEYLLDGEFGFAAADRLNAQFLAAQLRLALRKRFGPQWYSRPQAGRYLKTLWAWGSMKDANALARQLGYPDLSSKQLFDEIDELNRERDTLQSL